MSELKFTAGPWKATRSASQDGYDCWWITACPAPNQEKELATVVAGTSANHEGNARLIAAAPELYAALKAAEEELRLIRMKDSNVVYNPTLRLEMSLALAKAEGR